MTNALEIENLCKNYKGFSLDNVSFTLPSGCIMGLIGENGAGKSTIIKLILDMIKKDGGKIKVLGTDNLESPVLMKENLGVVLDETGLPRLLNAKQINSVLKPTFKNWDEEYYFDFLNRLSVPLDKPFNDFSKGMKMKLAIAAAMSHKPKLLILDEATNGLDPVVRDEITDIFSEFTRDENHSVLISSHIVSDLEKICDYIAFIHKGKLMLCEEKDILRESYAFVHCTENELRRISPEAVIGKKISPYGAEAIVLRSAIPHGMNTSRIDIEQLFVFMAKEDK